MPDQNPTLPPRVCLTSLPIEVLRLVASHLPRNSLLALVRAARAFTPLADDPTLWRTLYLNLPTSCGVRPRISPAWMADDFDSAQGSDRWYDHYSDEGDEVIEGCRLGLKKKIKTILNRGSEASWGMVKAITVQPTGGAVHSVLQILDFVAPTLEVLNLESADYPEPFDLDMLHPDIHDTLDMRFAGACLSLPSLTHIRLASASTHLAQFCIILCSHSPNLLSLDVSFMTGQCSDWSEDARHSVALARTKLRELRCTDINHNLSAATSLLNIVKASPGLRHLFPLTTGHNDLRGVLEVIHSFELLQDLYWTDTGALTGSYRTPPYIMLRSVRRVVLMESLDEGWGRILELVCKMPKLEKLYLDESETARRRLQAGESIQPLFPATMLIEIPLLCRVLRRYPRLHTLHTLRNDVDMGDLDFWSRLDHLERSNRTSGHISSMVHGEEEVICVRLLVEFDAVTIEWHEDENHALPKSSLVEEYTSLDGTWRTGIVDRLPYPTWRSFADYKGLAVPPGVIEEMRAVEGGVKDWDQRGVAVGAEAWAVLCRWYDEHTAGRE